MDREKVVKGLEHCKIGDCVGCPYDQIRKESLHGKHYKLELVCNEQLTEDILALLKEDETRIQYLNDHIEMCKEEVERLHKEQENASKRKPVIVCPHCGKKVK